MSAIENGIRGIIGSAAIATAGPAYVRNGKEEKELSYRRSKEEEVEKTLSQNKEKVAIKRIRYCL